MKNTKIFEWLTASRLYRNKRKTSKYRLRSLSAEIDKLDAQDSEMVWYGSAESDYTLRLYHKFNVYGLTVIFRGTDAACEAFCRRSNVCEPVEGHVLSQLHALQKDIPVEVTCVRSHSE